MKTLLLSGLLFMTIINVFGYNDLKVGDPRNTWSTNQGTIESATLTVHPKGLFMEYGLYLTFSSRGSNWTNAKDSLEVTLNFDLPENAILHDSWLLIGNNMIQAKIMDKWTASTIYENIVKRRRDPSIIMKKSATQYELRVFPMAGNQTRKVKITYLMPTTWNKSNVISQIPTAIINTSANKPASFPIITWADTTWTNPQIISDPDIKFVAKNEPTFGDCLEAIIPSSKYQNTESIGFNSPLVNGLYFSQYQKGNEGMYQLALFPDQFITTNLSKKAAILIDYDASNTNVTAKELLTSVKNELLLNLSSKDSFNLMFSNLNIRRYSEKWIEASKTNIEAAFNSLTNSLSSYSNLGALLENGLDFVKKHGNNGKIVLITDGDQYDGIQVANTLINDIIKLMNPKIPIHISDYQSINYNYYYKNGQSFYGNDYFYSNLSKATLGSYHTVRNNLSISQTISGSLKYLGGSINSFDLHTSLKSGFCYSRQTMNGTGNMAFLDEAILQVGKFKGQFPFLIEISGEYNNKVFSEMMEIQKPVKMNGDSTAEVMWAGQYIKSLESGTQSNDMISEIIYSSLNDRVLSQYTSFICLEDTNYICNNCVDEKSPIIIGVKEVVAGQDSIAVYPNPFVEKLSIELMCTNPADVKESRELGIVDVTGSLIYRFTARELQKGKNLMTWNGMTTRGDRVKSGVYMLIYKTNGYMKSIKIVRK